MARTRVKKNFMMASVEEVNYEDTEEGKYSGNSKFSSYFKEDILNNLLDVKGSGSITFDVIPFEINNSCGVAVPVKEVDPKTGREKNYGRGDLVPTDKSGLLNPGGGSWGWVLNYGYHEISTNHEEWVASGGDFKKKKAVRIICPRTYGEKCPICDKHSEVKYGIEQPNGKRKWPGEKGSAERTNYNKYVVKHLEVKYRSIMQIDVLDGVNADGDSIVGQRKFWDVAHQYYQKLLKVSNKRGILYYDDSEDGAAITVDYENVGVAGQIPSWENWMFENRDEELTDEALDSAIDLSDIEAVFNIRSYDEIMELLEPKVERKEKKEEEVSDDNEEEPPFDPDEEEEVEEQETDTGRSDSSSPNESNPPRSRARNRRSRREDKKEGEDVPEVIQKVLDCPDGEALDDMCSELDIDIYFEDYADVKSEDEQVSKCKEDMIEFIKKNIL